MADLLIHSQRQAANPPCALCGTRVLLGAGPQLVVADSRALVCRACGKKHAPALVALIDLASAAERVGRIKRHTVFPPLASLLDLARAAEDYLHAAPHQGRRAA